MDALDGYLADTHSEHAPIHEIPRELRYEILVDSEPVDVLSLQSTCKSLHDILHIRAVWIFVLRSLCRRRYIFVPSFPVDEMDVTRVERAALGPFRFARLLQDNSNLTDDSPALRPIARRIVSLSEPKDHEELYLVPGGRFLVTASKHAVDLWDLGYPDCSALKQPHHVAQVGIEEHRLNYPIPIQPEVKINREDELRVCDGMGGVIVNVYDIRPADPAASFCLIGSLILNAANLNTYPWFTAKCTAVRVEGDIVFVEAWSYTRFEPFLLWNVRTGWYGLVPNIDILASILYRDKIVVRGFDSLTVYDIPLSQRQRTYEPSPSLPEAPNIVSVDNVDVLMPRDGTEFAVTMSASHSRLVPGITAVPLSTGSDPYRPRHWTRRPHFQLPLTYPQSPQDSRDIVLDIACTWDHHVDKDSDRWKADTTFLYRYLLTVTTYGEQGDHTWYNATFKELGAFQFPRKNGMVCRYALDLHPPGRLDRGAGFGAGYSCAVQVLDDRSMRNRTVQSEHVSVFSPDCDAAERGAQEHHNGEEVEGSFAPVRLTKMLDRGAPHFKMCIASGRVVHAQGEVGPPKRRGITYVSDFLSSSKRTRY